MVLPKEKILKSVYIGLVEQDFRQATIIALKDKNAKSYINYLENSNLQYSETYKNDYNVLFISKKTSVTKKLKKLYTKNTSEHKKIGKLIGIPEECLISDIKENYSPIDLHHSIYSEDDCPYYLIYHPPFYRTPEDYFMDYIQQKETPIKIIKNNYPSIIKELKEELKKNAEESSHHYQPERVQVDNKQQIKKHLKYLEQKYY